jgi:hypothetical protein
MAMTKTGHFVPRLIFLTVLAVMFYGITISVPVAYCENSKGGDPAKEHLKQFTADERAQFQQQADLIFEGTISAVEIFKGNTVNALEGDISKFKSIDEAIDELESTWLVGFKIDKVTKGDFSKDKYEIFVHSPVDSFGFHISDSERNKKSVYGEDKYRIYIKTFSLGDSMIAGEILSE